MCRSSVARIKSVSREAHQSLEWQCAMAEILSNFGSHNGHLVTNAGLKTNDMFHSSSGPKLS
jgi:hypothetical protein